MDLSLRLTINHLRLIIAIGEEASMVGAARRLNMTQPAVTKSLQVAESLLDVQLFNRTGAGIMPTVYGQTLIRQARIVMAELGNAAQEISDLIEGKMGRVVVGALSAPAAVLLPRAIVRLRKEHPSLVVNIVEGANEALIPALRRGEIDFIIGRLVDDIDRTLLSQEVLFSDALHIVGNPSHPLVGRRTLRLSDLAGYDWVLPPPTMSLRRQIDQAFRNAELEPPPVAVEARSIQTIEAILLQTDYLTAWPWAVAGVEIAAERLGLVPVPLPSTGISVGITSRLDVRLSPAAAMLIDVIRATVVELQSPIP